MNANEMTLEQCRDWLAKDDGWNQPGTPPEPRGDPVVDAINGTYVRGKWWRYLSDGFGTLQAHTTHPYPPTLDGAAGAIPYGWHWTREWQDEKWWSAFPDGWDGEPYPSVPDTGNPTHDLYRLAVAARMAMKGTP